MANHGKAKTWKRWGKRVGLLACVLIVAVIIWSYLAPTLTTQTVTQYTPYTVESRDISTALSFGGTVSILHSQSVSVSESTTVRAVYVTSAQTVSEGDKLIQLEDGEVLKADIDGVVNQIRAQAGGWAPANMTLVQVCDLTNMQIQMSVDEYDITGLSIGQPCSVYILSLDMTFDTQIAHINRVSNASGTVAYYTASIELTVPEEVMPGMQASITIPQESVTGVTALPVGALSYDDDGNPFVYIRSGEEYRQQPLTLGLNDGMYVQITEGLTVGDTVYNAETAEVSGESFSLESLYKSIFGENVVINEGERSRGNRGGADAAGTMEFPDGAEMPEGMTLPEGVELPEGMEAPTDEAESGGTAEMPAAASDGTDAAVPTDTEDSGNAATPADGSSARPNRSTRPATTGSDPDEGTTTETGSALEGKQGQQPQTIETQEGE